VIDPLDISKDSRDRARSRFKDSLSAVRGRLAPQAIKRDVIEAISERAKQRPLAAAGIIIATALIALRKPIFGALKRRSKEKYDG
jgi:hypothetical protein